MYLACATFFFSACSAAFLAAFEFSSSVSFSDCPLFFSSDWVALLSLVSLLFPVALCVGMVAFASGALLWLGFGLGVSSALELGELCWEKDGGGELWGGVVLGVWLCFF